MTKRRPCMRVVGPGLATLTLASLAFGTELSGSPEELLQYLKVEKRTVTMRADAEETAYTDVAKITLVVVTKERELAQSIDANARVRERVRQRLRDAGIAADKIKSSKYSASPQYGWFGKSPNSFEIVNSILVEVSDNELFKRVAELADGEDEVSFGGVEFEHSEKDAFADLVRDKATSEVLSDAAYFEAKLGLTLTPVSFTFTDVDARSRTARDGYIEEIVVTGSRIGGSSAPEPQALPSFDEIDYRVSVTVTFEVSSD